MCRSSAWRTFSDSTIEEWTNAAIMLLDRSMLQWCNVNKRWTNSSSVKRAIECLAWANERWETRILFDKTRNVQQSSYSNGWNAKSMKKKRKNDEGDDEDGGDRTYPIIVIESHWKGMDNTTFVSPIMETNLRISMTIQCLSNQDTGDRSARAEYVH